MNIDRQRNLETMTVHVHGRVDSSTAAEFEQELLGSLGGITRLVLDLAQLAYISSAGLRVLLKAHKTMKSQGGILTVQNANEEVREVFAITGFLEILNVEDAMTKTSDCMPKAVDCVPKAVDSTLEYGDCTPEEDFHELKKGNQSIRVHFRAYREGDEEAMIACIRDEYADTYFRYELYNPTYIRTQAKNAHMQFLIAETDAQEIAGMMLLKPFSQSRAVVEIASQILRKKYRGFGIAECFFQYAVEMLRAGNCRTIYCYPVLFHNITQRLQQRMGMRATGLRLNLFDMTAITHSFPRDRNCRQSEGIMVMPLEQMDIGTIYLPEEHVAFCAEVYERLGVRYRMERAHGILWHRRADSVYNSRVDEHQRCLELIVEEPGENLGNIVRVMQEFHPPKDGWTMNLYLNLRTPLVEECYQLLKREGFFFTGLQPLCGGREYMIMHHPGEVQIYFEDYAVSEEFAKVTDYVKECKKRVWGV